MTLDLLLHTLARRWHVLVASLVVALAAAVPVLDAEPVYHAQTDVLMVAPGATASDLVNEGLEGGLIAFAGLIEREVNAGAQVTRLSSSSASLYGAGVRQGVSVAVPNVGGQWENSFARPVLSVEVVDATPEQVRAGMRDALARVERAVVDLQVDQGVAPAARISVGRTPVEPTVSSVGATRAGRARAALALGMLGVAGSVLLTVGVDRRLTGRRAPAVVPVGAAAGRPSG